MVMHNSLDASGEIIMNETERLRRIAASIIEQSTDDNAVEKAAELLKIASEIEKERAEGRKLAMEEQKIRNDLTEFPHVRKGEAVKAYISLMVPVLTTAVLAGTLLQQSSQFVQSEKDKQQEVRRLSETQEDMRWADAVKLLARSNKLSPAGVVLKSFVNSPRYGVPAYRTAVQILDKTDDPRVFADLFGTVFDPVDWSDLPQVLELNRTLYSNLNPLLAKSWNPKERVSDMTKLTKAERHQYAFLTQALVLLSAKVAPVLKGPRPAMAPLDLRSVSVYGDLQGADLSGANIEYSNLAGVGLKGVNLRGVTGYQDAGFTQTAWWQASQMNEDLLEYLIKTYPYNSGLKYLYAPQASQADYEAGVARLRQSISKP